MKSLLMNAFSPTFGSGNTNSSLTYTSMSKTFKDQSNCHLLFTQSVVVGNNENTFVAKSKSTLPTRHDTRNCILCNLELVLILGAMKHKKLHDMNVQRPSPMMECSPQWHHTDSVRPQSRDKCKTCLEMNKSACLFKRSLICISRTLLCGHRRRRHSLNNEDSLNFKVNGQACRTPLKP